MFQIRFLRLLSEYDWMFSALVVDINGDLTSDDEKEINENFTSSRKNREENLQGAGPAMFLATAYDRASEAWTRSSPNVAELRRLVAYATSSANLLAKLIMNKESDSYRWECLFCTPLNNYDAVILLHRDKLPYPHRLLFPSELNQALRFASVFPPIPHPLAFEKQVKLQKLTATCVQPLEVMIQVDLVTGSQKPIAWIDDAGKCYFPELSSMQSGHDQSERTSGEAFVGTERNGAREIKLHIEIDLNALNNSNVDECVEESNVGSKRMRVEAESVKNEIVLAANCKQDVNPDAKLHCSDVSKKHVGEDMHPNVAASYKFLDAETVRNMFLMAMKPLREVSISEINKCSSSVLQIRLELFDKQVEITKKLRGNANVQYAWLPCSKGVVSSIMTYGPGRFGHGMPAPKTKYGFGVHLSAVNCAYSSACYCDVDENGEQHLVFCRVILGSLELLHLGSQQYHPSSEQFDCGVDDLDQPSQFVVWNMNMNSHIIPEYVVSFKMPSAFKGAEVGEENKLDLSGVPAQVPQGQLQMGLSSVPLGGESQEVAAGIGCASRAPKSPSIRFAVLFEAICDKISAKHMNMVVAYYELFRQMKISRDDFIMKLRMIVGDEFLKYAITSLHAKPSDPAAL